MSFPGDLSFFKYFQVKLLVLNRRFLRIDFIERVNVHFRLAVIGVNSVLLLLNVGELCVAEAEHIRIAKQNVGQTAVTLNKFFFRLRTIAITPRLFVGSIHRPFDAAILADKHRQTRCVLLAGTVFIAEWAGSLAERIEALCEDFRILLVIMHIVNVRFNVIISARINAWTGRVILFGRTVYIS